MVNRMKTGGRELGTPNKLTSEVKELLKKIIENQLETLEEDLKTLSTKDRFEILVKLLPYIIPKEETVMHQFEQVEQPFFLDAPQGGKLKFNAKDNLAPPSLHQPF